MLYKRFVTLMDHGLVDAVIDFPANLRQYYADQLMLIRVQIEFGRMS